MQVHQSILKCIQFFKILLSFMRYTYQLILRALNNNQVDLILSKFLGSKKPIGYSVILCIYLYIDVQINLIK